MVSISGSFYPQMQFGVTVNNGASSSQALGSGMQNSAFCWPQSRSEGNNRMSYRKAFKFDFLRRLFNLFQQSQICPPQQQPKPLCPEPPKQDCLPKPPVQEWCPPEPPVQQWCPPEQPKLDDLFCFNEVKNPFWCPPGQEQPKQPEIGCPSIPAPPVNNLPEVSCGSVVKPPETKAPEIKCGSSGCGTIKEDPKPAPPPSPPVEEKLPEMKCGVGACGSSSY